MGRKAKAVLWVVERWYDERGRWLVTHDAYTIKRQAFRKVAALSLRHYTESFRVAKYIREEK